MAGLIYGLDGLGNPAPINISDIGGGGGSTPTPVTTNLVYDLSGTLVIPLSTYNFGYPVSIVIDMSIDPNADLTISNDGIKYIVHPDYSTTLTDETYSISVYAPLHSIKLQNIIDNSIAVSVRGVPL
jgi:hypothetical protein